MYELADFGYQDEDGLHLLPDWARYLIALGRLAVSRKFPNRRLVVGVSVPTRAYAAAFCALGVASTVYLDLEQRDPRAHFDWLASLPPGTPVRYRSGTHLHYGELSGVEQRDGVEYIRIGGYRRRWEKCNDIVPVDTKEQFVSRRLLCANPDFVARCAPGLDPIAHASYTSLDCLIVGVKEVLRSELAEQEFVCMVDGRGRRTGVLNDLLRCDAFEANANDHDRTSVISAFANAVPERLRHEVPPAVVYDGASAYLRMRSHWRRSAWVIVIDRTSPSANAAGDAFNQELARSIEDADVSVAGKPPPEIEVAAYYEAVS